MNRTNKTVPRDEKTAPALTIVLSCNSSYQNGKRFLLLLASHTKSEGISIVIIAVLLDTCGLSQYSMVCETAS
jgi:hypothetical protein